MKQSILWSVIFLFCMLCAACVYDDPVSQEQEVSSNIVEVEQSNTTAVVDSELPPINDDLLAEGFLIEKQDRHFNTYYRVGDPWTHFELFDKEKNIVASEPAKHLNITYLTDNIISIYNCTGSPVSLYRFYHTGTGELTEWYEQAYLLDDCFLAFPTQEENTYYLNIIRAFDDAAEYRFEIDCDCYFSIVMLGASIKLVEDTIICSYFGADSTPKNTSFPLPNFPMAKIYYDYLLSLDMVETFASNTVGGQIHKYSANELYYFLDDFNYDGIMDIAISAEDRDSNGIEIYTYRDGQVTELLSNRMPYSSGTEIFTLAKYGDAYGIKYLRFNSVGEFIFFSIQEDGTLAAMFEGCLYDYDDGHELDTSDTYDKITPITFYRIEEMKNIY